MSQRLAELRGRWSRRHRVLQGRAVLPDRQEVLRRIVDQPDIGERIVVDQ